MVWCNLPLYHLYKCLLTLCHNLFVRKDKTKYQKYGGNLRQTMVDSWYCLDRFVLEGISQVTVSRRLEVGNTKRRSLNTRLSSGTSAGTFAVSAGPYRNCHAKAGMKNELWHVFGTISTKGLENRSSRFEPKNSRLSFSRGSGPPLLFLTPVLAAGKEIGQNLRFWYKTSHFGVLSVHDLLKHLALAGEITKQGK